MRKLAVVSTLLVLVMTGCTAAWGTQRCPEWAGYQAGAQCDVSAQTWQMGKSIEAELSKYDQLRLNIIEAEVLIDNADNIVIRRDDGKEVDFSDERLHPGVYIVKKETVSEEATFTLICPNGDNQVYLEYVRLHEE